MSKSIEMIDVFWLQRRASASENKFIGAVANVVGLKV